VQQRGDVPVGIGLAGPFLVPQDGIEGGRAGQRRIGWHDVGEHPDPVPLAHRQPPFGEGRGQVREPVGPGVHADPVPVGNAVERRRHAVPVAKQPGPQRKGIAVADEQGHDRARGRDVGDGVEQRGRVGEVHQHALAQHRIEAGGREQLGDRPGLALDKPHPVADLTRLGRQRGAEVVKQPGRGVEPGDRVPAAGEQQRLGPLTAPDVEYPARRPGWQVRRELPGHHLLAHHLPQRP
jgi:hypothetical protein